MRYRVDPEHPLTTAAGRRMHAVQPLKLVGWVFGGVGLLFLTLGVIFAIVGWEQLPLLADPAVWVGETPDELALAAVGVVFLAVGVVFTGLGGAFLMICRRQRLLREELERFGIPVTGEVADIHVDGSVRVNGRSPLRIMVKALHPATGEMKTLRGPMVWDTQMTVGDAVEVLFDPQSEKRYAVKLPGQSAR